ncbi:MAG: ABC transporter permease [Candidatus Woesearchaeota archaeon]
MNKYLHIARTNLINNLAYLQDVIWNSAFIGVIIFIFYNLWKVIFGSNEYIAGFTIVMMLWYLVMTESIVTAQSQVLEDIGDEMITGNIANYLNKPYSYILYKYAYSIGRSIIKFFTTFIISSIIVLLLLGPLEINPSHIPFILLIVLLAMTLNFIIMAFLGIFAFWLEDAKAIEFVYNKIVFTLGGMLVPLEIFPQWLQTISLYLPFSYIAYYPAKLFVGFEFGLFFKVIAIELVWITVFIILTTTAYKLCIRRVSINGG